MIMVVTKNDDDKDNEDDDDDHGNILIIANGESSINNLKVCSPLPSKDQPNLLGFFSLPNFIQKKKRTLGNYGGNLWPPTTKHLPWLEWKSLRLHRVPWPSKPAKPGGDSNGLRVLRSETTTISYTWNPKANHL